MDGETCYRALRTRDRRFDGLFYVGVSTTGIYCRPICPARPPARERCTFFPRAADAERAGFRACFRCRPELAPGVAQVDSIPRLVRTATAQIDAGYLNERSIDELAASLGVSARHLRRAMEAELGVSPIELAQTRRLAMAKQLLHDTQLPIAQVAFASGFASVRRFNALFRARFGRAPSDVRRDQTENESDSIALRLDYRPPLAWPALLAFLRGRAIAGVEEVGADEYRRHVALGDRVGTITVRADPERPALWAHVSVSLAPKVVEIAARLRALFDLDARPDLVAEDLGADRLLAPSVRARPGLRVPGAFDGFEIAVRAVLGQQVSVRAATTLSHRFADRFGRTLEGGGRAMPSAGELAERSEDEVRAIGLPAARARTIVALARAVAEGRVELGRAADPAHAVEMLERIPGIGPWTSRYVAMRALGWRDAFPGGDLVVRKVMGVASARAAEERSEAWRPWRAYAVMHLWALSQGGGG